MNRLQHESSLYLRQHANNPVDWYPWGTEAIEKAKAMDRPIFLSIGYSACHWCHVMEHECFENETIASYLNDHFVSIKVDREERPDLDHIYMTSLQVMTREGGGWPLSVWLTPDLHPFFAGTYFPPDNRYGFQRPSFPQLLRALQDAWKNRRSEIQERSLELIQFLQEMNRAESTQQDLDSSIFQSAFAQLSRLYDPVHGGFGQAPKFPHTMDLQLLLRLEKRLGQQQALEIVTHTLDQMGMGGIYDQIGGGFHRYSTDGHWLVPHFEKMLYDNALLALTYTEAYQRTGKASYRQIVAEILHYVEEELCSEAGAFYCTQDADSEGVEGKFYVWTLSEIQSILSPEEAKLAESIWNITPHGNFEGHQILYRRRDWDQLALDHDMPVNELLTQVQRMKKSLYEHRSKRVWPSRDEKLLTAWNGLMITAYARASWVFHEPRWLSIAELAALDILKTMRDETGNLYRSGSHGIAPKYLGYLDDYAALIQALGELFQASFIPHWLATAKELTENMIRRFADFDGGGFYYASADQQDLIVRHKDNHDGSTPSGNSLAAQILFQQGHWFGRYDWLELSKKTMVTFQQAMKESPVSSAQMLMVLDQYLSDMDTFLIVGSFDHPDMQQSIQHLRNGFNPHRSIIVYQPSRHPELAEYIPLLHDIPAHDEQLTIIRCIGQTCGAPMHSFEALCQELDRTK